MIVAGTLLVPDHYTGVRLADGWLRLEGGRIAEVHADRAKGSPKPDLGGPNTLISPGFIDGHVHLPQFDSIGHGGLALLDWLARVIFPAETRWEDADFAGQMTLRVVDQLVRCGTTGFAAYSTVHHAATRAAVAAVGSRGLRAAIGQVLMDRGAPPELTRPAAQLLREAAALSGHGRVETAVTPRFALSCTQELLVGAGELAAKTGSLVQSHLAETRDECAQVARLFAGLSYTEVYRRAGLLTPRAILGHGIWLEESDRGTLAEHQSAIAHCPTANVFLRSGSMDRAALKLSGVRMALGSDVAGGPDRSMVRVARAMIVTAMRLARVPPSPAESWHQITAGNADILGWTDTGRLAPGAAADILVINPDLPWQSHADPLSLLLYAWDDRWLQHTLVAGAVAYAR